jgi:hypothetical protein
MASGGRDLCLTDGETGDSGDAANHNCDYRSEQTDHKQV